MMFKTRDDVEALVADLQEAVQNTRRQGFTATAEAMADVLRGIEQFEAWRQLPADELGFLDYGRYGDSSFH